MNIPLLNTPINKQTRRIISKSREQGIVSRKIQNLTSKIPFPIKPCPTLNKHNKTIHPNFNLTGLKKGRITVIGLADYPKELTSIKQDKNYGQRWVVKCTCGNYQIRRHKTLLKTSAIIDMCQECRININL